MDQNLGTASSVLDAIVLMNEDLIALAVKLRSRAGIAGVRHLLDARKYQSGPRVEVHIDVELETRRNVCWSLEVRWSPEEWIIESSSSVLAEGGHSLMEEFPTRLATTIDELRGELKGAVAVLTASAETFDFTNTKLR